MGRKATKAAEQDQTKTARTVSEGRGHGKHRDILNGGRGEQPAPKASRETPKQK